ncbi:50S ribosomal protein L3 [Patescibacteria group bacterium]|nr:50S ribosomal protein L3 [Patescibacteria group bacterium]
MKAIVGRKLGMTQIFKEDKVIPVTVIEAGPVSVLRKLTKEKDGYDAVQVGFQPKKKGYKAVKEIKGSQLEVGDQMTVSVFEEGDKVKISGISKGKGFQGGVKRHGFHGRKATHGVKHEERTIGSVGSMFPQRVIKGRRMPGRMGAEKITTKNLQVVQVDAEKNLLSVKGAVPGRPGTLLFIQG